jgi:hypothetical protein
VNDHRVPFFLVAALACFVLVPPTPPDFRWLAITLGCVYVLLALASWLDARDRHKRHDYD